MRHGNNMPTAISGRGRDCDSETREFHARPICRHFKFNSYIIISKLVKSLRNISREKKLKIYRQNICVTTINFCFLLKFFGWAKFEMPEEKEDKPEAALRSAIWTSRFD